MTGCTGIGLLAQAFIACAALLISGGASARPLAEVKLRGSISLCANPDSLPHSSQKADPPGFQIEIARAIAADLGVQLHIDWIVPRMRAGLVDCDMLLDTIADPASMRGPVKLSMPYQKSGVALALRGDIAPAQRFDELPKGRRVGVMINSLASRLLNQRGIATVPYAFEGDMVDDLAKGELEGCAISPASIAYYIQQHPEAKLRYTHAYDSEPELRWNLSVALRRSDDAMVEAVNQALAHLAADGTFERIYTRYGVDFRQP